jgi:TonB-linked SusC/RagA family outer membrane protein
MKKIKTNLSGDFFIPGRKYLRIMKLTFIFMLWGLISYASATYSQSTRLTFESNEATIESVFKQIESLSEFKFAYNSSKLDVGQKISVKADHESIDVILDKILGSTDFQYKIVDRYIIINDESGKNPLTLGSEQTVKSVKGKVIDQSGTSLPGVSVVIKGTTTGVITDSNGNYSIANISENSTLQFSFVGMEMKEIVVGGQIIINVVMQEETVGIEEVVAVGYGTQKKVNLTGSVATINSEKLTIAPVASTSNALVGRLPGLITKQQSGLPGTDAAYLSIRGFDSPLVIVDGIETTFNNIDANEIESLSVLKDASAAIYGARAGNGVILVTTKRGNIDKPTITLNSSTTYQGVTNMLQPASSGQNAEMIREQHLQAGLPDATARFSQEQIDLYYAGTNPDYANTNWLKEVTRSWSPQQQHNLSVRGGNDKIKYYGFFGYIDQQSMFKNHGGEYQRYNVRSNIDAKILDNLSLQLDLSSIVENRDFPTRADEKDNSVWQDFWNTEPYYPARLPDPTKISYANGGGTGGIHIMTNSEISGYKKTTSQNITGTLSLNYDFNQIKGLSAKAFVNYKQDYSFFKDFSRLIETWTYEHTSDTYTSKGGANNPSLTHYDSKSRVTTGQFSLNYDRTFANDHHITALALYEVIDYSSDWITAGRVGYMTASIDYLFAGGIANQKSNGSAWEMGRQSYIGRLNYAFKSKYLLESTLRFDESAKFDKEHRKGIFPSVSVGWRLSEEEFIKNNLSWLENLKLRGSFSQTGNDAVGNFQYLSGYQFGKSYIFGSSPSTGLVETGLANPLLTWETMTIANLGLDFSINKRKLYGEFDVFYRNRVGIPGTRQATLPSTFGASLPLENLNKINDRGFELMIGHQGEYRNVSWDLSANISWSRSKWGFFDEPVYDDPDQIRLSKRTGQWTDIAFGYKSDGLFTSQEEIDELTFVYNETQGNTSLKPGDVRYVDTNNDGLLNWRDQVEIGKGTIPHWIGGFNINLKYKNFDLSALTQGAFGFYHYLILKKGLTFPEVMYKERWTYENNNPNAIVPRLGGAGSNDYSSDYKYVAADYLRLKNLSIGYNLSKRLLNSIKMKNLRLYVAGTNLFTASKLKKYSIDPEAPSGYGGYYYPQMRTITFGINLSL